MSQEGAARLRLKPRKAPAACSREPSPGRESPGPRPALTSRASWFEKDNLNEFEKPWSLLLKNISQDFTCTSWQSVPSFPEFFEKSSEEETPQKQEAFTVGTKDFPWVPFPSFCKKECLKAKNCSSQQVTQSQTDHPHEEQGQADKLAILPSTAEKMCSVGITDQAKDMVGEDPKRISKLDASPKSCEFSQPSSTHHLALSQSSAQASSFQQHHRKTVQKSREENDRKELQILRHEGSISPGEAGSVPAEETAPLVSQPRTESCKETENKSEGSSTLDSCPMCLIPFSGTLSQMDIDAHLARCLSQSADDVMW
ncbi:Fanconi anemia core complex-associated protein 20 [Apus apus]|uniref:Fanconi anemia core complex-associated protein 20 n=1 Tax=Apus apus TaxID=8895 RepID=UPI0021F89F5D|nr:Fanconi anemia core complex-associated protein 20 [Apus apus]